jgi:hypothetical protein
LSQNNLWDAKAIAYNNLINTLSNKLTDDELIEFRISLKIYEQTYFEWKTA